MILKDGLVLKQMGEEYVVIAKSADVFRGMVKLNKSGAFVFELMQKGLTDDAAVDEILKKYDVSHEQAREDFESFVKTFKDAGLLYE